VPVALKLNKLRNQSADLETEIRKLTARNQVLENELKLLKSDPVYIEYTARKTFNKSKEGEVIYKLVEPQTAD
jgi:cell division protein FtsB